MSLVTHSFDLPIMPGSISPVLQLSQYDDARTFTAHLKDENGNAFTLPSGASAKLEGMNRKGVTFEQACAVSGSDITFTPKEAATDQPGLIAATLHIKNGNENISTLVVILNVQKAGATKEEQARSPGFTDAIVEAVNDYFDNDPPFFELPEGGQEGQALISDGEGGAEWRSAGAELDTTLTQAGKAADAAATGMRINSISTSGSGLTGSQIAAIAALFQLAVYAEDPSDAFDAFIAAFPIYQDGSALTIIGGVTASLSGSALTLS